ncbi:hypothetical protein [Microbacterium deminutum]|uniref:Uncharacterized protein n=1 Tax=Microbacterium deminutum TaxID=344164 RepID=A0ABN2QHA7_9MICO
MQRLHYAGDTIVISDEVSTALLAFAAALAEAQTSEVVAVPVLDELGIVTKVDILLGPASQLFATPVSGLREIETDGGLVADLRRRTSLLRPHAGTEQSDPWAGVDFDL